MHATGSTLHLLFVVAAVVCWGFAGLVWVAPIEPYYPRVGWLGMFFFGLSLLF
jgi:hypothetical protein